jgi:hypothetical protein
VVAEQHDLLAVAQHLDGMRLLVRRPVGEFALPEWRVGLEAEGTFRGLSCAADNLAAAVKPVANALLYRLDDLFVANVQVNEWGVCRAA